MDFDPLLTVAEAAGLLRISTRTVVRRIHAGELSAVRIGGQYRVLRDGLPALRVTPTTPRAGADRSDRRPVAA